MQTSGNSRTPGSRNPWLKRLTRISAWGLLAGTVVLGFSGWGITQTGIIYKISSGLVDRRLADAIHRAAIMPVVFFFLAHVLVNIRLNIKTKRVWTNWLVNAILIIIGGSIMVFTIYLQYFRRGG